MFELETKLGEIKFSPGIINRIVLDAVESCDGRAEILNYKGKYMNVVPGIASRMNLYDEEAGGIQVQEEADGVFIRIFIVMRFGASIKKTTTRIINYVYEYTEKIFGEKPKKVTVVVTGTFSKNIAKRHIEVSKSR